MGRGQAQGDQGRADRQQEDQPERLPPSAQDGPAIECDAAPCETDRGDSADSNTKPTTTARTAVKPPRASRRMKFRNPLIQRTAAPKRPPQPSSAARTTTTSESTGVRRGRSGMRPKQPSKVRTVSHKRPRASTRHSMSQNAVHQRTSAGYR